MKEQVISHSTSQIIPPVTISCFFPVCQSFRNTPCLQFWGLTAWFRCTCPALQIVCKESTSALFTVYYWWQTTCNLVYMVCLYYLVVQQQCWSNEWWTYFPDEVSVKWLFMVITVRQSWFTYVFREYVYHHPNNKLNNQKNKLILQIPRNRFRSRVPWALSSFQYAEVNFSIFRAW